MTRTAKIEISGAWHTAAALDTRRIRFQRIWRPRKRYRRRRPLWTIYVAVVAVRHSERAGEDSDLRRLRLGGAIGKRGLRAAAQVSGAAGEMAGSGTSLVAGLHSSDQRVFEKFQATLQESVWRP
jgi:hypothetical protein